MLEVGALGAGRAHGRLSDAGLLSADDLASRNGARSSHRRSRGRARMSFVNKLLVGSLPLVPKFIVGKVAARYVAGETIEDALNTVLQLNSEGAMATVDLLGE